MNLQPILQNDYLILLPLKESDFDELYQLASNPKVWQQHPQKNRYQKDVFHDFFKKALQGNSAFKIVDKQSNQIVGTTRYYDLNQEDKSIFIGFTFLAMAFWGKGINAQVKHLMLDYIFQFVSKVYLHVAIENIRSQKAIERLGAKKIAEQEFELDNKSIQIKYLYLIEK